ncbi:hypothetical protein [Delftia acidovorans]|jgi:NAD(P)-dependent dehydrogenase (short-subunit alcohol dehydrogenase family)|uniref:hypothetical protein n=1 Tax=Delftia acidovorans TaxID=80866 RepID=UPI00284D2AA9|nr:hypothetical protein [Delftia acidovorans]
MNSTHAPELPRNASHPFSLDGKAILVVGADTPTGRQAADTLARRGAQVIEQPAFTPVKTAVDGFLYCTASAQAPMGLADITESLLHQFVASRLAAPVLAIRQLMEGGLLRDGASIVLEKISFASAGAQRFVSVEGGLGTLAASLALECAAQAIRVNTITTKAFAEAHDREDFAHAAVYLLSPASRWVTGSDLVITGQATR